jgi:hypothetical protein
MRLAGCQRLTGQWLSVGDAGPLRYITVTYLRRVDTVNCKSEINRFPVPNDDNVDYAR